jgi:hypothetical protein
VAQDAPVNNAPGLADVTQGNNTVSFTQNGKSYTVPGFSAQPGYDLASGVGTVNAALFVPGLARPLAATGISSRSPTADFMDPMRAPGTSGHGQ